MKKLLLLPFLLLALFVNGQTVKNLDYKYGFRDVVFEKAPSAYKGMVFVKNGNNGVKLYQRKTDKLSIGEYKILNLAYVFFNNKLSYVTFKIKEEHNSEGVLNVLRKEYGTGEELIEYPGSYIWVSEKANMIYLHDNDSGNTEVSIKSTKMEDIINAAKRKKESAATSDL